MVSCAVKRPKPTSSTRKSRSGAFQGCSKLHTVGWRPVFAARTIRFPNSCFFCSSPTTRRTYATRPDRCHVSHVVADTNSWEQKLAQTLEDMPEVFAYVKNQSLSFAIPYTLNGEEHDYYPDFIVRVANGHGPTDLLNLILECTGRKKKDKEAKVSTAQTLWVAAEMSSNEFSGSWPSCMSPPNAPC